MKLKKYVVIGGQYDAYYYGSCDTLLGAKRLASKNAEYWDNWQGWHYPKIYLSEDVRAVENFYGDGFAPAEGAHPVCYRNWDDKTWSDAD